MSVNVENMRKWVARLRDPEAKQARGVLRDASGAMCCLGHACDVSELAEWDGDVDSKVRYLGEFNTLPEAVVEWLGVDSWSPQLGDHEAWRWNDHHGKSLPEIADLIEAEWPELKVPS